MRPSQVWPGFGVLPDFPEARNKRAAFRDSVKETRGHNLGDLLDPREFFGFGTRHLTFGQLLEGNVHNLQAKTNKRFSIEEGSRNGATFYRVTSEMESVSGPLFLISVWSSDSGYNPVSAVFASLESGEQPVQDFYLSWNQLDGIYVPFQVRQARYQPDGTIAYQRMVDIEKQILNQPLDPHLFGYRGLGLKDGELIIDNIENAVYVMREEAPEKLANFGDTYTPSALRVPSIRGVVFIATVLAIVVLFALILRKRLAGV
jgi:hypothetical protein